MPSSCCAPNCTNRHFKGTEIKFHRFPLNEALRKRWVIASRRKDFLPSSASFICSEHFKTDDYLFSDSKKLKEGSIPSVFDLPGHLQISAPNRKPPAIRFTTEKDCQASRTSSSSEKRKTSPSE